MSLILPVAFCLVSGYAVVLLGWSDERRRDSLLIHFCLSVGFGIGIFSLSFAFQRFVGLSKFRVFDLSALLLFVGVVIVRCRGGRIRDIASPSIDIGLSPRLRRSLVAAVLISVCVAIGSMILRAMSHPHGDGWDAFAIWNLHARFLFLGGENWRDGFTATIPWSHPDYPLLLPAAIAHFWSFLGYDSATVPLVVSLAFALSTMGLLYASLLRLRGPNVAMLGTLTLASTPFFVEQAAAQFADIPLSFFFLAAIGLLCLHDESETSANGLLMLAGLSAGFAAWTKNEGLLFLVAAVLGQTIFVVRGKGVARNAGLRRIALFLGGSIAVLLTCVWFKHSFAPPGNLFANRESILKKVLSPWRYWVILNWYGKEFLRFGEWIVPATVLLLIIYFALRSQNSSRFQPGQFASLWTLGLTLSGYFAIYLITPYDLFWHLRFSLNRLFLQNWPSIIFVFFLLLSRRDRPGKICPKMD